MPTYDYRCKDCGHELEVVQSFTDDALTTCEQCGGALRKLFGSVGISFKGSGFYKNDSRSSGAKANGSTSDSKGADSSSSDSSSSSSDAKAAGTPSSGSSDKAAPGKGSSEKAAASSTSGS